MRTITSQQAQSIIDIACGTWKPQLAARWANKIVLKENIEISEKSYQDMRKACTAEQHQLFDKIFGKDVKFKVGDYVLCGPNSHGWGAFPENINNKIVKITSIKPEAWPEYGGKYYFNNGSFLGKHIVRLATPEEIKAATVIPEGTPCFVRDELKGSSWHLYYADGNGRFYPNGRKSGSSTVYWNQVRKYSDGLPEE